MRTGFQLEQYWNRSTAEFLLECLPRYYATFTASQAAGERVRVRLRFDAEEEAVQFALSFGADLEVVEPGELRARVAASARAIVEQCRA